MKSVKVLAAMALVLGALCGAASAMSIVPGTQAVPGTTFAPNLNGLVRDPNSPNSERNPYGDRYIPYGPSDLYEGSSRSRRTGRDRGFLNVDPFDPNSVMNSFDRYRYANPYPYDPLYNPYGRGPSPYAPNGPNVPAGNGIPYGR